MISPETISAYRVFPRIFSIFYLYLAGHVAFWFMGLPDPTGEQSAYAVSTGAVAVAWFKFYVEGGK